MRGVVKRRDRALCERAGKWCSLVSEVDQGVGPACSA